MTDDLRALPLHRSDVFDRAAFDAMMVAYPRGWTVRAGAGSVTMHHDAPAHVVFSPTPERSIRVYDVDGTLRTTATTADDLAVVEELFERCRDHLANIVRQRNEQAEKYRAMPELGDGPLTRDDFDALLASENPIAVAWQIRIDDEDAAIPERAQSSGVVNKPSSVLFVRRIGNDFRRVWIYDVDGVLRTSARTVEERAFLAEMVARTRPALDQMLRLREERVARAIASAPTIDRDALVEALTAMTHGRVDVGPIADAVMAAATDPRRYVKENAKRCAEYGIHEPVEDLHVVVLLQHLPHAHLLYFDWKESMHEVLPLLADVLRAGPGLMLDVDAFADRCDAWDRRRSPMKALAEISSTLAGVALVEIKTSSDSYAVVCVPAKATERIRTWKKKAHLPLVVVTRGRE